LVIVLPDRQRGRMALFATPAEQENVSDDYQQFLSFTAFDRR
jgi:hypothetical protein